jgi:LPXTG-motif cell wall-anchored protein
MDYCLMRTLIRAGALSAVAAVTLFSAPAIAHAADGTYTVQLRQNLPRTSTTDDGGAPQESPDQCPGIPAGQDGWHFVLPGNSTDFVKLTVTFEPGGQQVVTDFGPPSDKHAYVASSPGAKLTSAVAEVKGGDLELFNLSHTCPAKDGTTPGTGTPSASPSVSASASASASVSVTPGGSTAEPSASPSTTSSDAVASSSPSAPGGDSEGDLAETGNGAPVGLLSGLAAALVAGGGYLVFRRRKA